MNTPLLLLARVNFRQGWRRLLAIRQQSRLLSSVISLFIAGYLVFSFWLFFRAIKFFEKFPGLGGLLVERLLFLLFAFLFVMLIFSNIVIAYTNFFKNRETSFLLTLPLDKQVIFQWKFLESTLLASWAFLFLIAPLLAAYGLSHNAPWHFYLVTSLLTLLFIFIPAVLGTAMAIALGRYLERRTFQLILIGFCLISLTLAFFYFQPEPVTEEMLEIRVLAVLDRLLQKTKFANLPFLPSYWLASSVLHWSEGALRTAGFFMLVLLSNVLFLGSAAFFFLGQPFYDATSAVASRASILGEWGIIKRLRGLSERSLYKIGLLEKIFGLLQGVRADSRAIIIKDLRVFWRDTTQWGQTLVLFGLLGVYIINLRHFSQQLTNPFWINLVSYLNLGACSLNLATLTTRFIFPQFSLEGKRLWIIGLAPLGLPKIIKIKYVMATTGSLIVTLGLITLSCRMLKLPLERTLYFSAAITLMTLTLNACAMGLGVLYPNFKEENPSKIVSGFGGTFCLVLSFLYILGAIILLAMGAPWSRGGTQSFHIILLSLGSFLVISLLIGGLPLYLGLKRVARFEI